jgi:hypothetical protein
MHRYEQSFADGENVAGINNGARLWMNNQSSGQSFRGNRCAIHMEPQMKITQNLQRVNPRLEGSMFIPQQPGTRARSRNKLPGSNGARKLQGLGGRLRKCSGAEKEQTATQ